MPPTADDRAKQARFVFKGTVVKLRGATMPGVEIDERTAIVRVDEILQAPEALADTAGMEITLQLGGRKKAAAGEQFVFYANGWLFGDGIACQSIDHRPAGKVQLALAAAAGADPVEALAQRDAQVRVESAEVVVSGRVRSVSLPPERAVAMAAAAADATVTTAISEHDPFVQEAEIEVDAVHKGSHAARTVRLLFPNSRDVKWYKAPKFRAGQEGLFILHKDEAKQAPKKAAAGMMSAAAVASDVAEGGDDVYTALHPADFQPAEQSGAVMSIIAAATGAVTGPK